MGLLRLAAIVLFVLAALSGFDWLVHTSLGTLLGLVAAGLACWCASGTSIPQPPSLR
jgi:hypothetical protein